MSTSEATFYGWPGVAGGGTSDVGTESCAAKPDAGVFPAPGLTCTLAPGHDGQHEAGTTPGLMVASWTEEP